MTTNATKTTATTTSASTSDVSNADDGLAPAATESTSEQSPAFENDSAYSKAGLAMWLNNTPDRAEEHFRARLHSTPIFAGYVFIVSMNGVIAYEMDRIEQAQRLLKDLERRCAAATTPYVEPQTPSPGWFASVRYRLFGGGPATSGAHPAAPSDVSSSSPFTRHIEEQIILADAYLSSAILTFLTQDITGLMRGSWLLRKAWKIYQSTYAHLYERFMLLHGEQYNMPPMPSNYHKPMPRSKSDIHYASNTQRTTTPLPNSPTLPPQLYTTHTLIDSIGSISVHKTHPPQPEALSACDVLPDQPLIPRTRPTHLALLPVDTAASTANHRFRSAEPVTCPTEPPSTIFHSPLATDRHGNRRRRQPHDNRQTSASSIEAADVHRLMGAVSFGYGIFQLSASLLPLSLLRIISFFGFEGNRVRGIDCLMYARLSDDMRAPLATLALLWFYTFGSQMLKYEDGYTTNQALAAANLITESERNYPNSAIFLFFRGRVERMQANSLAAVRAYQRAFSNSAQKELRLLCLHEIAWCKLIQLDFDGAQQRFNELREVSVFSKAFYTYMTAICQGAAGCYNQLESFGREIGAMLAHSKQRDMHIGAFVQHRLHLFRDREQSSVPVDGVTAQTPSNIFYWKYLVYEVLFLWSAMSSSSVAELTAIIADCSAPPGKYVEPMAGLQQLILGGALVSLKQYQAAVTAYRSCIAQRGELESGDDFHHVSAYAHYELAMLLLQCSTDYSHEAKQLLRDALNFKGYDMENRLVVHVQKELRKLG